MADLWTLVLSIAGLIVTGYLSYSEKRDKKLVCLMGEDCNKVVKSRYGKIFGIPNAYLGVPYYIILAAISIASIYGITTLYEISLSMIMLLLTILGVVFYGVLVYIQFYKIRSWCGYCIGSAVITAAILYLELMEMGFVS
jgi:uncharacterized membrane protein